MLSGLISLLISLLVLGLILWLIWWVITLIPLPPPFATVARVIFGVICVIALLSLLFGGWAFPFAGHAVLR